MVKGLSGLIAIFGGFFAVVGVFMRAVAATLVLAAALPGLAQEISILDLNTQGVAQQPFVYLAPTQPTLDGRLFFRADSDDGDELWVTDGTAAGTSIEDLSPGAGSSVPDEFTAVGDRLFFSAISAGTGRELWSTLGPNQTFLVADLEAGSGSSSPRALTALGDDLYFSAEVAGSRALYTVDSVTVVVTEVAYGIVEVDFDTEIVEDNSRVYFKGTASSGGDQEIWASDGTTLGTEQATDLGCPEWGELLGVGTSVFVVCDFGSSTELFRLDPTPATGVVLVHRFGDRTVNELTPSGGTLYMVVGNEDIWAYDNGTGSVSQVTAFGAGGLPGHLTRYLGNLVFSASGDHGRELFWTDGATVTEIGIRPGIASSNPYGLQVHDGLVYFIADDGVHGRELWTSDGTVAGTELAVDFVPGPDPSNLVLGPSTGFGLAFTDAYQGLWVTDGTAGGTAEIPFFESYASSPSGLLFDAAGERLFFVATLDGNGEEPYVTDGTVSGTFALGDIEPGESGSSARFLATLPNGRTLFTATSGADDRQLWSTEGLADDAMLTTVIHPGGLGTVSGVVYGEYFYFCADDGANGTELWRSDGTSVGTGLFLDLNPTGSSDPCDLAVFDGDLYFGAEDAAGGALWRSDGTIAGSELVVDTSPASFGRPRGLTVFGDHLYFTADDGVTGEELWRSDGSASGTTIVADINPGPGWSSPSRLLPAGGLLYFVADDGVTDRELWRTDGTPAGTVLIADIDPDGDSDPIPFAALNGGLVFRVRGEEDELYFTDGVPGSATLLLSGYVPSCCNRQAVWDGRLYFSGGDLGAGSADLWRTDGTPAGTENLQLEPLGTPSAPSDFAAGTYRLFFGAYDTATRREIHILERPLFSDGFESGGLGNWSSTSQRGS